MDKIVNNFNKYFLNPNSYLIFNSDLFFINLQLINYYVKI